MPDPNPQAMEFLLTRRSRPAKTLTTPVPTRHQLGPILQAGARSPDHGKLEPWRFIVLQGGALTRLAGLVVELASGRGLDEDKTDKARRQFADAALVVAVVSSPVNSEKIPAREQMLSAGAVCLAVLNAALASGWGANWLTGWMAHDPAFLHRGLGLTDGEFVAGFVHVGTEGAVPPERPRPDMGTIIDWVND